MAARWRVVSDQPYDDLRVATGEFVPSRLITFELLDSGAQGKVIVSMRNYSAEYVATEIQRQADTIQAVGNL